MTTRGLEQSESETDDARAKVHARGLLDGYKAATLDRPEFLDMRALLQAAWEITSTQQTTLLPAHQDEYFVGWVRGYVRCVNEAQDMLDTWEDEGGALTSSWLDVEA